jgi:hypothetical protein
VLSEMGFFSKCGIIGPIMSPHGLNQKENWELTCWLKIVAF